MGTANRGNKPSAGGGTAFVAGTVIEPAEANTDFDNIYNEFNGNIEDINIDAVADIDQTKVDDFAASAAEYATAASPGDTESPSFPSSLQGEITRLRYQLESRNTGIDATRVNAGGTTAASWTEPARLGPNLVYNPGLGDLDVFTARNGWENTNAVPSVQHDIEPYGRSPGARFSSSAGFSGFGQVIATVKPSTKYLVITRVRVDNVSSTARLSTAGADATSGYRDISITHNTTSYVFLKGVVQTDATPTPLTVNVENSGGNNSLFSHVGVYEMSEDPLAEGTRSEFTQDTDSNNQAVTASYADIAFLDTGEVYSEITSRLLIDAQIPVRFTGTGRVYARFQLTESVGPSTVNTSPFGVSGIAGEMHTIPLHYVHEIMGDVFSPTTLQSWSIAVQIRGSSTIATINDTLDTESTQSELWVQQLFL